MTKRGIVALGLTVAAMSVGSTALAQQKPVQDNSSANVQVTANADMPPADQPLVENIREPFFSVEGGAGVLGYTGGAAGIGPAWNVRAGVHFPGTRFGLEGQYLGSANRRAILDQTMVYTSLDASARLDILDATRAPLVPFVTAGLGWAGYSGTYGDGAALVVPVGVGAERLITNNIKAGARFNFRPAFGDNLGTRLENDETGGDTWSLIANIGGAF